MTERRNNSKDHAIRTGLEALGVVIVVNVLFLVLFRYAPAEAPVPTQERTRVTLLDLGDSARVTPGFLKWLEYHDPALFIQPDRRYGYGAWGWLTAGRPEVMDPVAAVRPPQPELPTALAPRLGVLQPMRQNWSELLTPAVLIELPGKAGERRYPQVSFNGRSVGWEIPGALAAEAAALGLSESRIGLSRPVGTDLPMRWDLGEAGSADVDWRRNLYLAVMEDAAQLSGGESGELVIQWRAYDAGGKKQ